MKIKIFQTKFTFYTNIYRSHCFIAEDYEGIQIEGDLCVKFSK